ncbi:MAG: Do family serine endopeptidase [Rhodobacteraceae bacterium]|nr:Do family serine endopeptidase [Paracoccaceae bacterium]
MTTPQPLSRARAGALAAYGGFLSLLAVWLLSVQVVAAQSRPDGFADLAERISPAVVNIATSALVAERVGPRGMFPDGIFPEGSPFEDFFREFAEPRDRDQGDSDRARRASGLGSGFVISADGYLVTNHHVIAGADEITVELLSGEYLPAKVIGSDPNTDIALLKIDSESPLPYVRFGDSDSTRVGDWVMAVGNPLGQGFSVSVGIVSARNRVLASNYGDYIQTDAAINRGNSGGPLFNLAGEVVGVNTAILSPNGGSIGIGFSIASNAVVQVVNQLQQYGQTRRGWLGVQIQDVSPDIAQAVGLEEARGSIVTGVLEGPARMAGVQVGDIIVGFDGKDIEDTRNLVRTVAETEIGKSVPVEVLRDGREVVVQVILGRREEAERAMPAALMAPGDNPSEGDFLGIEVALLDAPLRRQLGLDGDVHGLLVRDVDVSSSAYEKGLRKGDVITEAGQQAVQSIADMERRISETREAGRTSLLVLIRREGSPRFLALSVVE